MRHASAAAFALLLVLGACSGGSDSSATKSSASSSASSAPSAPEDTMVDVGGHKLHIVCQGTGSPAVLIETGAGESVSAFNGLQPALAATNRTCVYERAGNGTSEASPSPRTAQQISDELQVLIENTPIPIPFVLLSHSLGGMYAQLFAAEHATEIAGLVFLDPRTAEYQLSYRTHLTPDELAADAADTAQVIKTDPAGPEIAAVDVSAAQVKAKGTIPPFPTIVLTAGVPFPGQSESDLTFWRSTHENLAAQSPKSAWRIVDGAEHDIWRTHETAVLEAVASVVSGNP
jgi:pimeloyl-ACP methyl ester carboxylesterase